MVGDDAVAGVDVLAADHHAARQTGVVALDLELAEIVTLFASTRITLLAAPPQSEPGSQTGFDIAGSITVDFPEPFSVTGLVDDDVFDVGARAD